MKRGLGFDFFTFVTSFVYLIPDRVDEETDVSTEEGDLDVHVDESAFVNDPENGEKNESHGHESDENEAGRVADGHCR